ncbi:BatD family protein [Pseudomonas sp. dw_358]|uniref:BatD family protein n=1 Tax=Pseudomonas sp. dw_358 TaxID=2720083 RepID=UPI001BD2433A|nr:BatD family protein [Pseudomonas sp. dw_358]
MSRVSAFFICCLLALLALPSQASTLVASVDRTRLGAGETVELTLQSNDVTQFGKPDLSTLEAEFEVRDTRQVNRPASLETDTSAATRWLITLLPRHTGTVVIPALQLGDAHSEAITLQVLVGDDGALASLKPVFIDANLDTDRVYVQAQAVLTVRVYHSVALYDDSRLSPPQITDAKVEQLGDVRTYEKIINGVRHGVIEMRFAIYPQRSGQLTIPALVFNATLVDTTHNSDGTSRPGELLRITSAQIPLDVRPRPDAWPADAPWLPARSVTLSESWNPETAQSQVGDSLTRTLTLKADGLSSAQLPPLPATNVNGLRRYPDQPQLNNQPGEQGLVGSRDEREALVPARSGNIELPPVDVVWWNTREDHLEHSNLPARTLRVVDNPTLAVETPVADHAAPADNPALWPWKVATVLFAFTTLLGFILWWRARSQPAVQRSVQAGPSPRSLLDDIKRACQANDTYATRQAIDAWARQQPETLADMAARFVPLSDALDGLNGALYSEAGQYWQGGDLWRAINAIPAVDRAALHVGDNGGLPPLYPK